MHLWGLSFSWSVIGDVFGACGFEDAIPPGEGGGGGEFSDVCLGVDMVVGKHFSHFFAYGGLVVEIQIHLTAEIFNVCSPKPNVNQV